MVQKTKQKYIQTTIYTVFDIVEPPLATITADKVFWDMFLSIWLMMCLPVLLSNRIIQVLLLGLILFWIDAWAFIWDCQQIQLILLRIEPLL